MRDRTYYKRTGRNVQTAEKHAADEAKDIPFIIFAPE